MGYRTDTRALVLAVLRGGAKHGYGIGKAVREISGNALKLGEGQLYPILHELEEKGWISGEWEIVEGDPPRRVYAITDAGLKELERRRSKWKEFVDSVGLVLELRHE